MVYRQLMYVEIYPRISWTSFWSSSRCGYQRKWARLSRTIDPPFLRVPRRKYFWNLPKIQLTIRLEQRNKGISRALQNNSGLLRVFRQLMYVKFIRESVGHPSGAALDAVLKGKGPGPPGRMNLVSFRNGACSLSACTGGATCSRDLEGGFLHLHASD